MKKILILWNFSSNKKKIKNIQGKVKVPEIKAPAEGGTQLETPKIEVIREPTPDRKSSLAPGVYCLFTNIIYFDIILWWWKWVFGGFFLLRFQCEN